MSANKDMELARRRGHSAVIATAIMVAVAATGAEPGSVRSLRAAAEGTFLIGVGLSDSIAARPQDWPLLLSQFRVAHRRTP